MKGRQTLGKCPQTPGLEGESGEEHSPADTAEVRCKSLGAVKEDSSVT